MLKVPLILTCLRLLQSVFYYMNVNYLSCLGIPACQTPIARQSALDRNVGANVVASLKGLLQASCYRYAF